MGDDRRSLICNNGSLVLEFLNSPIEEEIKASELIRWIDFYLRDVVLPTTWKLSKSIAEIAYEQTTVIFCEVHGDETYDSPVDYTFADEMQTLNHLIFVCEFDGNFAVMGSLLSSTFFDLLDSGAFLTYDDIMKRETARLFRGIEALDKVDYFYIFDKIHDQSPPLVDEICEAIFSKFCKVVGQHGSPVIIEELQPYVFQYMLFAMSASDILADAFIAYERKRLEKRLLALRHNPFLQFELCRKWLRIDWRATRLLEVTTSHSTSIRRDTEASILHLSTRLHFPPELGNPSHYVPVRLQHFMGAHPFLKCTVCFQNECTARPPLRDGRILMPLQFLPFAAVEILGTMMRKWIQTTRREYHTHDALTLWIQEKGHKQWKLWTAEFKHSEFEIEKWSHRLLKKLTFNANDPVVPANVRNYVRSTLETRDNFVLLSDRDPLILERVIVGKIWASQCGLIPFFPVLKEESKVPQKIVKKHEPMIGDLVVYDQGKYSDILTHEAFLQYTSVYWPPCMHHVVEVAVGKKHMKYRQRLLVGRFILSTHLPYTIEEARRFWEIIWMASDVYKECYDSVEKFWCGEYGICFENFIREPYKKKLWPYCKTMAKLNLCPYIDDITEDIEDLLGNAQERCTRELLAHRRQKLQKKPNSSTWKLYFPAAFSKNLHTFN
jgi:hypothetical protein